VRFWHLITAGRKNKEEVTEMSLLGREARFQSWDYGARYLFCAFKNAMQERRGIRPPRQLLPNTSAYPYLSTSELDLYQRHHMSVAEPTLEVEGDQRIQMVDLTGYNEQNADLPAKNAKHLI